VIKQVMNAKPVLARLESEWRALAMMEPNLAISGARCKAALKVKRATQPQILA
jgi:hypothetical protein